MIRTPSLLLVCASAVLTACATPEHRVVDLAEADTILRGNYPPETLGERIVSESLRPGGCLRPGSAGRRRGRCEDLRDLITPPQYPDPPEESEADEPDPPATLPVPAPATTSHQPGDS